MGQCDRCSARATVLIRLPSKRILTFCSSHAAWYRKVTKK